MADPVGYIMATPLRAIAAAPTWPAVVVAQSPVEPVARMYWGGLGRIAGTVKIKGVPDVPVRRRVRLVREIDAVCLGETWSDAATGAYEFVGYDPSITYTVIVYDAPRLWRASVQDAVVPEAYVP